MFFNVALPLSVSCVPKLCKVNTKLNISIDLHFKFKTFVLVLHNIWNINYLLCVLQILALRFVN